jgi:acetyl-CoA synthetase
MALTTAQRAVEFPEEIALRDDLVGLSWAEVDDRLNRVANGLHALDLGPARRVAVYAENAAETVLAHLGGLLAGASTVPVNFHLGVDEVAYILADSQATVVFVGPETAERGLAAAASAGISLVIGWRCPPDHRLVSFEAWLAASDAGEPPVDLPPRPNLMYTSGTTGRPKGTVHTHAGCLAQTGKELRYAFNVQPGEPFFWVTDIGWMMGPWEIIGCLLYRTPIVLFDGAPNYPTSDRIWEICARLGVVTLGCSPTLIRLLMRATEGRGPAGHDLSRLRVLGSTGEPWDETSYRWYLAHAGGGRCPVINISGGTEILGCLLSALPLTPLRPCSLGGAALGMDVAVFGDDGRPVPRGTVGHLVCRQPAPSMTKSFLHDDARYLETYFSQFPNVWYHGDWARQDEDGSWFVLGRSDDTIKVAGKRVGPAEVEGVLTAHPAVSEAATIGAPDELKGQVLVCFVVLKPDRTATPAELTAHVAAQMGKPLAPQAVHLVAALPKTRSGKILRGTILRVYSGQPAGDLTSVDNPAALDAIRALPR